MSAVKEPIILQGTVDQLERAWLWPYVKKWETIEIPVKLKEAMDKTEKKG